MNMYGVYQAYYSTSLASSSASAISWIGSIQAFLLFLVGTLVGPIYDSGYVRSLLAVGSFLSVFGLFMTSICHQYWQYLLAQGVVTGTGFGCLFLPGVTIVSQYFDTKKAFATGVASLGSSIGTWEGLFFLRCSLICLQVVSFILSSLHSFSRALGQAGQLASSHSSSCSHWPSLS